MSKLSIIVIYIHIYILGFVFMLLLFFNNYNNNHNNHDKTSTSSNRSCRLVAPAEKGIIRLAQALARSRDMWPHKVTAYNSSLAMSMSSVSNINVASGGMTPPAPRFPYAISEGITSFLFSPTHISINPSSQPLMT